MITTPPIIPPVDPRIHKSEVTEKDPHHEQQKKKQNKQPQEIEDKITIEHPDENKKSPPTNLEGHIDIEA